MGEHNWEPLYRASEARAKSYSKSFDELAKITVGLKAERDRYRAALDNVVTKYHNSKRFGEHLLILAIAEAEGILRADALAETDAENKDSNLRTEK
jgi:hypothetical protein